MTEYVERNLQAMSTEIQALKNTKLYSNLETCRIIKTRKDFEYKINGLSKHLRDFKAYINYEKVLLKQIHNRRIQFRITDQKSVIEYSILKRVKRLYEIALKRFSNDLDLYLSYFKLCKESKMQALGVVAQDMIKSCPDKPAVWKIAAAWYAHDCKDLNSAFRVLNKGLALHKDSEVLYTEAIKLSLLAKKGDHEADKVCNQIQTYVESICASVLLNGDYLIEILNLLEDHEETLQIQKLIISHLLEHHSQLVVVWHTLAQRELRGLHYPDCKTDGSCLDLSFAKYREGLRTVEDSEKAALWSHYVDCIITAGHEKLWDDMLIRTLEEASNNNCLPEQHYIVWLQHVDTGSAALEVFKKACAAFPQSVAIWKLRLRHAATTNTHTEVFEEGVKSLQNGSLPLWQMYISHNESLDRDDVVAATYQRAFEQCQEISNVLKPEYINWLARTKGMDKAREVYSILARQKPFCKEIHTTMATIEPQAEKLELVHRLACEQFGREDPDVWIHYVQHVLDQGGAVEEICEKAEQALDPSLYVEFREHYDNLLVNNCI